MADQTNTGNGAGVAIEVRNVSKSFHIAGQRSIQGHERRRWSPGRPKGRDLEVLKDLSFDINQGEFFGIVGRNGSGKSTLLKLMASVYKADAGRIRVAGRLAPILELGVGFNPDLPAYDNVILNGTMMGLSPRQARHRYDRIIEFAGLGDYADLKVKDFSSGMKARLGFAIVINVDADILVIDEVLAVGDAEFQERCGDVFGRLHRQGKTVVLVTHNMQTVVIHCQRAMLIHEGQIEQIGEPAEVVNRYLELALRATIGDNAELDVFRARLADTLADPWVSNDDVWLLDEHGERTLAFDAHEPINLNLMITAQKRLEDPSFNFRIDNEHGEIVFVGERTAIGNPGQPLLEGERVHVNATIENRLAPGRYVISSIALGPGPDGAPEPAGPISTVNFEVEGDPVDGVVKLRQEVSSDRVDGETGPGPSR